MHNLAVFGFLQEKLYLENLKASSYVLGHLLSDWKDTFAHLTPLSDLQRTVQVFRTKVIGQCALLLSQSVIEVHIILVDLETSHEGASAKDDSFVVCRGDFENVQFLRHVGCLLLSLSNKHGMFNFLPLPIQSLLGFMVEH